MTWEETARLDLPISGPGLTMVTPRGWVFELQLTGDSAALRSLAPDHSSRLFEVVPKAGLSSFGCAGGESGCAVEEQRPADGVYEIDYPAPDDQPFDNVSVTISEDTMVIDYTEKGGMEEWQATYDIGAFHSPA